MHDELLAYHRAFAPLFQRAEQRHWALKYLEGQLLPLERKSIEPMADALVGGNVQAMQQFISVGAWDDDAVLARHQQLVAETLGDPATGVLIVDGCDFPKQGTHSVGVARQWCGALGKVANCQASVVACYASARGFTLVDRRLYVHEDWFTEAYAARRRRCGVPADLAFQTRTELAWAMIAGLRARGALPFRWVTGDEHFGNTPVLLDRIAAAGLAYFMEVPHNVRVWAARPADRRPAGDRARRGARSRGCGWPRARPPRCAWTRWRPRCRRPPGRWRRSRRAARGRWWPRSRSCARWRCATGCPARTSGWCCGARWTPRRELKTYLCNAAADDRARRRWSGCWGCAGRWSRPSRRRRTNWGWTTTRCGAGAAGTTTPP